MMWGTLTYPELFGVPTPMDFHYVYSPITTPNFIGYDNLFRLSYVFSLAYPTDIFQHFCGRVVTTRWGRGSPPWRACQVDTLSGLPQGNPL